MLEEFKNLKRKSDKAGLKFRYSSRTNMVYVLNGDAAIAYGELDKHAERELKLMQMKIDWYLDGYKNNSDIMLNRGGARCGVESVRLLLS